MELSGMYSVKYGTDRVGCGRVTFKNGTIEGSDAGYSWSGKYQVEGTTLTGTLLAKPSNGEVLNVFGDFQHVELNFIGRIGEEEISITAKREGGDEGNLTAILAPI